MKSLAPEIGAQPPENESSGFVVESPERRDSNSHHFAKRCFNHRPSSPWLENGIKRENLEKLAQGLGCDMAKFKEALDSHKYKAQLDADTAVANQATINGTPAFAINGYFISGAQPYPTFKAAIIRALKEKQLAFLGELASAAVW